MRKIIKSVIVFALMVIMSVGILSACSHSSEGNGGTTDKGTTIETPNNGVQHYEIELTKNNFEEFFEFYDTTVIVNPSTYLEANFYEIKGVLTYAYYKNVSISFYAEYSNSDGLGGTTIYSGSFTIKLNAAGNYSFYSNDEMVLKAIKCDRYTRQTKRSVTITAVSGVVIFDI